MMKHSDCKIASMLKAQKRHISFHTPGHKRAGADVTELSYSDNLFAPTGVIAQAERDIAEILGADASFILTDGSTCGVHAMLAALLKAGCKKIAFPAFSHISVINGCQILGLSPVVIEGKRVAGVPMQPTAEEMKTALSEADALLITSPDYYGNFPPLEEAKKICAALGKPFCIDGAHGSHLHFTKLHAGRFADMWVDGAHKSLPALTQGAVVSANGRFAPLLKQSVGLFRTTSPSYPIMASVEYAVKYPRNEKIELLSRECKTAWGAYENEDWSKILIAFGDKANEAQAFLERRGVYAEFNDGNYLAFYLSPCTRVRELKKLGRLLAKLLRGNADGGEEPCAYACMTRS